MTDRDQTTELDVALSELLRLSVEWREAALSEVDVARKAHAITRLWGQRGVEIVAAARAGQRCRTAAGQIGGWLSAALDDPAVCLEMKADIRSWMEAVNV